MSWALLPLASVVEVAAGGGAPQMESAFTSSGTPFIRAGSLRPLLAGTPTSSLEHLSETVARNHRLRRFPTGTVVFAKSGMSATKGHVYRLQADAYVVNHLAALIPSERVDSTYLQFVLRAHSPTVLIQDEAYPSIRLGDIAQFQIPLPPINEQRRIAAILDQAETLRSQRRAALAQLDSLAQSIFLDMFGDPVVNPRNWPVVRFADVGSLDRGVSKHRPRNAPELLGGAHPLVQTGEVANCDGYIRTFTSTYSDIGLRQSKLWPAGTLCITIAANIAKTGLLTFDACFPDSVVGFRAADPATAQFVRVWLSFLQKALEEAAPESAQKNINLAILRELKVPLPPMQDQQTFATRIQAIESLKATNRVALAEFDALFASLQHQAFQGQL